jgi:c-di-GMP-binding flagellar brake protein YcgR
VRYDLAAMDRREFPRVNAPVFCRPLGKPFFKRRRATDISLGGVRIFADEAPASGDRLELELFLPDSGELVCTVEVVWVDDLPEGSPARYDVGVKFVRISPADRQRLSAVLAV